MPWKFVGILIVLILFVFFIGFNLENKTDISLGFVTFPNVPIFLSTIIAFIVGALVTIPLSIKSYLKKLRKERKKKKEIKEPENKDKSNKDDKKK